MAELGESRRTTGFKQEEPAPQLNGTWESHRGPPSAWWRGGRRKAAWGGQKEAGSGDIKRHLKVIENMTFLRIAGIAKKKYASAYPTPTLRSRLRLRSPTSPALAGWTFDRDGTIHRRQWPPRHGLFRSPLLGPRHATRECPLTLKCCWMLRKPQVHRKTEVLPSCACRRMADMRC